MRGVLLLQTIATIAVFLLTLLLFSKVKQQQLRWTRPLWIWFVTGNVVFLLTFLHSIWTLNEYLHPLLMGITMLVAGAPYLIAFWRTPTRL